VVLRVEEEFSMEWPLAEEGLPWMVTLSVISLPHWEWNSRLLQSMERDDRVVQPRLWNIIVRKKCPGFWSHGLVTGFTETGR
jgi:hypothetical protein